MIYVRKVSGDQRIRVKVSQCIRPLYFYDTLISESLIFIRFIWGILSDQRFQRERGEDKKDTQCQCNSQRLGSGRKTDRHAGKYKQCIG